MSRRPVPVRIGPVETSGRGGGPKLTPLPDKPAEDAKDLIFTPMPDEALRIRPRAPEPVSTAEILTQLSAAGRMESARNQPVPQPDEPPVDTAERDAAIDEIMTAILAEPEAAFQPVAALYQDFQVRCRIAKVPGGVPDLSVFREKLSVARAGVDSGEVDTNDWERAALIAAELPEDMRGVYLLLAKAALAKAPCPPNAEIAKAYGTRSPGRARWLLAHMEERGFLLCATDMRGNRIVTLTDLGWQTAPGDAEAAA